MFQQAGYQGDRIVMDEYNSDLHLCAAPDGVTGWDLHDKGFQYMWAGGRATHGVRQGRVCFECTVIEYQNVDMPETEKVPHVLRVGWSTHNTGFDLGETSLSYGFGGTGKISSNNKFMDYGQPFGVGDTITCYLDLDARPAAIFYAKNGQYLGVAFKPGSEISGQTLYPHVNLKNVRFEINFGDRPPRFQITQGFQMLQWLPPNALIQAPCESNRKEDHEILMMIGLPGSGKTTWAEQYTKQHPDKKYYILGTNAIIDKMKVMGLKRQKNYHGRWDQLIKQSTDCLNQTFKLAERKVRNYILDQTNVYFTARRRKMNNFRGFKRIAIVLVNTKEELDRRIEKRTREEGKVVPESAVKEMMANFSLPEVGDCFDEVRYVEEDEQKSKELVDMYKKEGLEFKNQEKKRSAEGENEPPSKRFSSGGPRGPPGGFMPQRGGPDGFPPRGGPDGFPPRGGPDRFSPRGPPPMGARGPPGGYPGRSTELDFQRDRDYQRGPPGNGYQRGPSPGSDYKQGPMGSDYQRGAPGGDYKQGPMGSSYQRGPPGGGYGRGDAPPPRDNYGQAYGDFKRIKEEPSQPGYGQGWDSQSQQGGYGGYASQMSSSAYQGGPGAGGGSMQQQTGTYGASSYGRDSSSRSYEGQGYGATIKTEPGQGQYGATAGGTAGACSQPYGASSGGYSQGRQQSGYGSYSQPSQGYGSQASQGYQQGQQGYSSGQSQGYASQPSQGYPSQPSQGYSSQPAQGYPSQPQGYSSQQGQGYSGQSGYGSAGYGGGYQQGPKY